MKTAIYIGFAGALGTICRYLVGVGFQRLGLTRPLYATFAVNILGAFLIGLCISLFVTNTDWSQRVGRVLTVGFLGGFTTYSAFAFETVLLFQNREAFAAIAYVGATLLVATAGCFAGTLLGGS